MSVNLVTRFATRFLDLLDHQRTVVVTLLVNNGQQEIIESKVKLRIELISCFLLVSLL